MSKMSVYPTPSEFNELWNMDFGGYATDALNECAPILEAKMKSNAKNVIKHPGDSDMVNSIKASSPKKARTGAFIVNVGPRGYSNHTFKHNGKTYKVSNALKAIWKEYGIPGRDQAQQPFIGTTVEQARSQIEELLQKKFEEKLK